MRYRIEQCSMTKFCIAPSVLPDMNRFPCIGRGPMLRYDGPSGLVANQKHQEDQTPLIPCSLDPCQPAPEPQAEKPVDPLIRPIANGKKRMAYLPNSSRILFNALPALTACVLTHPLAPSLLKVFRSQRNICAKRGGTSRQARPQQLNPFSTSIRQMAKSEWLIYQTPPGSYSMHCLLSPN